MSAVRIALSLGGSVALGVAVPWVAIRMLMPSLEASDKAKTVNFRGRTVSYGLGVAWLVWAGCAILGGIGASALYRGAGESTLPVLTLAGSLALVAFALGIVDDAMGTASDRGFRGHLGAMARGRLSTGGLKLIGIGVACLVVALAVAGVAPWGPQPPVERTQAVGAVAILLAGAAIALTSNFVNLTDLRPGRALKTYGVLGVAGAVSTGLLLGSTAWGRESGLSSTQRLVDTVALLLFALGPVISVWSYDLGERGMLGDAGANSMGAVAGLLIVAGLPLWGLVVYFTLMLTANLASERLSFSRLIDANGVLRWLDRIGRLPDEAEQPGGAKSSPQ